MIDGVNVPVVLGEMMMKMMQLLLVLLYPHDLTLYLHDLTEIILLALLHLHGLTEIILDVLLYFHDLTVIILDLTILELLKVEPGPNLRRPRGCVRSLGRNHRVCCRGGIVAWVPSLVGPLEEHVDRDNHRLAMKPRCKAEELSRKLIGELEKVVLMALV